MLTVLFRPLYSYLVPCSCSLFILNFKLCFECTCWRLNQKLYPSCTLNRSVSYLWKSFFISLNKQCWDHLFNLFFLPKMLFDSIVISHFDSLNQLQCKKKYLIVFTKCRVHAWSRFNYPYIICLLKGWNLNLQFDPWEKFTRSPLSEDK